MRQVNCQNSNRNFKAVTLSKVIPQSLLTPFRNFKCKKYGMPSLLNGISHRHLKRSLVYIFFSILYIYIYIPVWLLLWQSWYCPTSGQHFNHQFIRTNSFRIIYARTSLVKTLYLMAIMFNVSYFKGHNITKSWFYQIKLTN